MQLHRSNSLSTNRTNEKQIAEIMENIANRGTAFQQVDPIAWQKEIRQDRPLPNREP